MPWEFWLVLSALAGPVLAVQAQKWIERARERAHQRHWIFQTLMAYRANRLADEYVRALNLIDLNFIPPRFGGAKDKRVIQAWRALFGELTHGAPKADAEVALKAAWNDRCTDRLVELLHSMSLALGYRFSQEELRRGIYYPQGHFEREMAAQAIMQGLQRIFEGRDALPMKVTAVPTPPPQPPSALPNDEPSPQAKLTEKMLSAYAEDGALNIRILEGDLGRPKKR